MSQSTLSSAIKEVEAILGAALVDRSTRAFALTPAGEDVLRRAGPILAMSEDLVRAAGARRPLEGPFALGVIPTIAPFFLPGASAHLKATFPKLELFLREDLTAHLVERLSAGLLDAALLAFPYDAPAIDHVEIGQDQFWFAASPAHRLAQRTSLTPRDLVGEPLLLLEDGHCLRDHAIDACRLQTPKTAAAFGSTSLFTLVQMSQSGLGPTLLPGMAVKAGLAKSAGLAVVPFAPPAPARRIGLAWRKGSGRREEAEILARAFKECLVD